MIKEQFIRNLGIMTEEEIETLHRTTISIAGCGCIGGFSAELLARMGIGKIRLADPDVFDFSNINRQCAATHHTVGQRKVEALKDHLLSINPEMEIITFSDGINEENVDSFVEGANYVVDAIDYFNLPESILLHRAARKRKQFVTTAVALGFGTSVLTFSPHGMTVEEHIQLPQDTKISDIRGKVFPTSGYTMQLPGYATEERITDWVANRSIPTISVGQALGPGILVSQMVLHLLNRKEPVLAPQSIQLQFE